MILRNLGPPRIYLPSRRRVGPERPDVLLIQGFGTGGRAMEWIAEDLSAQGLGCAVPRARGLLGYLQTRRVPAAAAGIARLLKRRGGDRRTWLVGHSIGGIIARHVVQHQDHGDAVAGVITLGSPHRGTFTASLGAALGLWALSRAPFDVTPRARLLAELNQRPWPREVPLVSIYSRADWLCLHPSAIPPFEHPAITLIELPGKGHTELLWDGAARRAVLSTILGRPERRRIEPVPRRSHGPHA